MPVLVRKMKTLWRLVASDRGELVALVSWRVRSSPLGRAPGALRTTVRRLDPRPVLRHTLRRSGVVLASLAHGLKPDLDAIVFYLPRRLRLIYRLRKETGEFSLLYRPRSWNAKVQWKKLYCPDIEQTALNVDKYAMRTRVAEVVGAEHTLPLLYAGTSVTADDIAECGDHIMIKPSHRSGQRFRIAALADVDVEYIANLLNKLLAWDYTVQSVEPWYGYTTPRVLIEPWITEESGEEHRLDYRFYVLGRGNEVPEIVAHVFSETAHLTWALDEQQNRLPFNISVRRMAPGGDPPPHSPHYAEMLAAARRLAQGIDMVAVDFMAVAGTYYFTEMTYGPAGGVGTMDPPETQLLMGDKWHLDTGNVLMRLAWKHRAWHHMRQTEGVRRLARRLHRFRDEWAMEGIERADYTDPRVLPDDPDVG